MTSKPRGNAVGTLPEAREGVGVPSGSANPVTPDKSGAFRNRVTELTMLRAGELKRAHWNWRTHGIAQREAMLGSLSELGIIDAMKARRLPDGTLEIYDGHLRQEVIETLGPDTLVPVIVADLSDDEARKANLLLDTIAGLADTDETKLRELLDSVGSESAELNRLMADMRATLDKSMAENEEDEEDIDNSPTGMELDPHEHYDYLVVLCRTTQEWNVLCDRVGLKPSLRRGKLGTSRAMQASKLLERLK
jgi:hypothetical protein